MCYYVNMRNALFLILFVLIGCGKSKQTGLLGTWQRDTGHVLVVFENTVTYGNCGGKSYEYTGPDENGIAFIKDMQFIPSDYMHTPGFPDAECTAKGFINCKVELLNDRALSTDCGVGEVIWTRL